MGSTSVSFSTFCIMTKQTIFSLFLHLCNSSFSSHRINFHSICVVLVSYRKIKQCVGGIGNHCSASRFPISWTYFPKLFDMLECANQTKGFINASTNWQIINCLLEQNTFRRNKKRSTKRHTIIQQDTIILRYAFR